MVYTIERMFSGIIKDKIRISPIWFEMEPLGTGAVFKVSCNIGNKYKIENQRAMGVFESIDINFNYRATLLLLKQNLIAEILEYATRDLPYMDRKCIEIEVKKRGTIAAR
jgi:hypothetical protein